MNIGKIILLCLEVLKYNILDTVAMVTSWLYFHHPFYRFIGFFATKRFPKTEKKHKYAILIAARNESAVIGNLIKSINRQDYLGECLDDAGDLVTVFVVADNCTDNTAEIARKNGAVCYERQDSEHRTKGFALQFLVQRIKEDYGIDAFEAYFVFDADNLLKKDYITRMNEAFDSGEKIVTSYRNTKNFADNWIAAGYGIHWLRSVRNDHRPRSVLNLATRIQGTGFMFASEIIKDGWNYTSFTEDRAFAADAVVNGYNISYCDAAEFYDEQPTSLKVVMRQRIRWAKGHLQAFGESGPMLFKHIFVTKGVPNVQGNAGCDNDVSFFNVPNKEGHTEFFNQYDDEAPKEASKINRMGSRVYRWFGTGVNSLCNRMRRTRIIRGITKSRFFKSVKFRFMSYDMFLTTYPNNVVSLISSWLKVLADIGINLVGAAGLYKITHGILNPIGSYLLWSFLRRYGSNILTAVYIFFIERKRIIKIPLYKRAFYCIMWPWFDIIGAISVLIAMFTHVEWKPIPHNSDVDIDSIAENMANK